MRTSDQQSNNNVALFPKKPEVKSPEPIDVDVGTMQFAYYLMQLPKMISQVAPKEK